MGEVLEIATCGECRRQRDSQGVDLTVEQGEVHALMGPNGSARARWPTDIMGHPGYEVVGGEVIWKGQNILELVARRAFAAGIVPRVSISRFHSGCDRSQFPAHGDQCAFEGAGA